LKPEQISRLAWVDRYVRNEMTADEMVAFEETLMDSPGMQQELQAALGLRETLLLESEQEPAEHDLLPDSLSGSGNWQPLALAATVILALFSTVMFWKVSNDSSDLQRQLDLLSQPRTHVLTVPVNIMRSAGGQTPDVIIQKPSGHAAILLDIELAPPSRQLDDVHFALLDQGGKAVANWVATPSPQGRASVLLNSEQIPVSQLWLEISSRSGDLIERRLLEFR
jgi:hypothetical protein